MTGVCKICGSPTRITHHGTILGKHEVAYHLCGSCDYWCTDEPTWLDEAYSSAIAITDTGMVQRNLALARELAVVLPKLFPTGPYVDWAGGYGLLVRLMRDQGFDYYWQDRYAKNLIATGFDWPGARSGRNASLVTAMEVLEHTPDPATFVREAVDGTGANAIIFTQELHGGDLDPSWWYLAPDSGQHISFFSSKTLATLGELLGFHYASFGRLHVYSRTKLPARQVTLQLRGASLARRGLTRLQGRQTLTWHDHVALTEAVKANRRSAGT